ncbi:MAG: hypothetical protein NTU48_09190 [Legionellales bacterium]|nr:hypothetical protein [Legionellales bacterium]
MAKTKLIHECGFDEHWLQDQICKNPEILLPTLGANMLEVVSREKKQSSGGRLDILLRDQDNETFYEVEVMLGATNESHIIRTIEYWDIERKRWPKKQHVAVLIAEKINSRFYNVVNLLSLAIPIVGIQANIVSIEDKDALHFTKIIDSYEEPEIELEDGKQKTKPEYWKARYPEQYEAVLNIQKLISNKYPNHELVYHPYYVAIRISGKQRIWLSIRKNDKLSFEIQIPEINHSFVEKILNQEKVDFIKKDNQYRWTTNLSQIKTDKVAWSLIFDYLLDNPNSE